MEDYLRVGVISSTHGIKGEVKVFPTTDSLERFDYLENCLLDTGKELIELEVENVKYFKNMAIIKFKGYDNIDDIEKYKGKDLLVTRENAVPLEEGEFYIADLIGIRVEEENGNLVGELTDVLETGANNVFVVKTPYGKEILLPYIDDCVKDIDIDNKLIKVYIMPGLAD